MDVSHLNYYHQKRGYFGLNVDKLEDEETHVQRALTDTCKSGQPKVTQPQAYTQLTEPFEVFTFDFNVPSMLPLSGASIHVAFSFSLADSFRTVTKSTQGGTLNAVVFWFDLELVPGIVLSSAPKKYNPTASLDSDVSICPAKSDI